MKQLFLFFAAMAFFSIANTQSVGIGTNKPDSNAVMDIFSTNKGVLIPRILDTAAVTKPLEGVMIYNKNTRSPYYYNGHEWLSLGGRLPLSMASVTDRITYQVTGTGFSQTEEVVFSVSQGQTTNVTIGDGSGTSVGKVSFSAFNFVKQLDINSKSVNLAAIQGTKLPSIEFKFYASGASVPYLSYRLQNFYFESYQISGSAGGDVLAESVSILFENYGFKDWVNNKEFGFNVASNTISSY